jgi:hypothetical protein
MRNKLLAVFGIVILVVLLAWSPWLTQHYAETRAVTVFTKSLEKSWEHITDGCGSNCSGCGAVESQRVPFGRLVTLEYACGLLPEDSPPYHQRTTAFVSTFGTVHGLPKP